MNRKTQLTFFVFACIIAVSSLFAISTEDTNLPVIGRLKSLYGRTPSGNAVQLIGVSNTRNVLIDESGIGVKFGGSVTMNSLTASFATANRLSVSSEFVSRSVVTTLNVKSLNVSDNVIISGSVQLLINTQFPSLAQTSYYTNDIVYSRGGNNGYRILSGDNNTSFLVANSGIILESLIKIEPQTSTPSSGVTGNMFVEKSSGKLFFHNGVTWNYISGAH